MSQRVSSLCLLFLQLLLYSFFPIQDKGLCWNLHFCKMAVTRNTREGATSWDVTIAKEWHRLNGSLKGIMLSCLQHAPLTWTHLWRVWLCLSYTRLERSQIYHFIREDEILAISHCSLINTSYHRLTSKELIHITMSHSFELCWTYSSKNKKNSESAATSQYKEEKHHRMAPGHSCRLRKLYILYLWHWKHKYKTN